MNFILPRWSAPTNIKAFSTLRNCWSQQFGFAQLGERLQLPTEPIWLKQVHGNRVLVAENKNQGEMADGSFTRQIRQICAVVTADCLPILICNQEGTEVAAIHAGWRGLAAGIIEQTLTHLKSPPDRLLVWLGPAIGPEKFEVGDDVYIAFTTSHPSSATGFKALEKTQWLANLYTLAKIRLAEHGVLKIYGGEFCTYSQEELFFSYRRDQGQRGRMASLIWIDSDCI